MPSTGFYLFLLETSQKKPILIQCVNALNGLLLISSFFGDKTCTVDGMCQCPQRASTYFFKKRLIREIKSMISVNALNGLLLISSYKQFEKNWGKFNVSMPSTGFYLFLRFVFLIFMIIEWCVNALNGLLLISSPCMPSTIGCIRMCVNALNGLLLISSMQQNQ